jgi:putative flippase GtrA
MAFPGNDEVKASLIRHKVKLKFLAVGMWNTLFGLAIFAALYQLTRRLFSIDYFSYTLSQVVSTILAIINAYICHKYITFQSRTTGKKMILEFLRFSTTYFAVFVLGLIIMPFLIEILKMTPIVANLVFNIIVIITSYFGHSRFSFVKKT